MARETESTMLADSFVVVCVRLIRTLRAFSRSADLTEPEISALSAIVYSERIAARDLARIEGVTPATISRLVADMETKGLVKKSLDHRDARLQWIAATPLGKRRIGEGHARRVTPFATVLAGLPLKDRETLAAAAVILNSAIVRLHETKQSE